MHKSHMTAGLFAVASLTVTSLALLASTPAQAQSALGPYVFAGLGYDEMPDRSLFFNGATRSSQWKPGWGALAGVGYKWFFGLRTEAEYSARVSWIKTFNNAAPWKGTAWDNSFMVNGLYDFESDLPVTPFIGGGLGLNQIQWGNNFRVPTQAIPTVYDSESITPGWQGIAGVSYAVSPKVTLAVDGRMKGAFGHFNSPGSVPGKPITQFNYQTNSVFLSVRYSFE